jgi:hypothetical protein
VATASPEALSAWQKDEHRRPPLHYENVNLLHHGRKTSRFKTVEEDELLHFYPKGHTVECWKRKDRIGSDVKHRDKRGCLLGNSYSPAHLAFLIGELFSHLGWIEEPLSLQELVGLRIKLVPTRGISQLSQLSATPPATWSEAMERLLRWLFSQQCASGGAIVNIGGAPHCRQVWQEMPAEWFRWKTIISVPWRHRDQINICEARARNLAIRARARDPAQHQHRYLHLLDSQVNLGNARKGRTGSRALAHVLRNSSATLLAAGLRDINGFTRSEHNPADHGSRDRKAWAAYRRGGHLGHAAPSSFSEAVPPPGDAADSDEERPHP